MKKIVLIIPSSPWLLSDTDQPMTGVLYISSFLKKAGFETQVCDLSGLPEKYWHIPIGDIYGITGTTPNFPWMKKVIDRLKEREPHKKVIVGGVHATTFPEHIFERTKADICVIGEGEHTALEIMQEKSLSEIDGIVTREFETKSRILEENIDIFPLPDRDSIDYYNYLVPQTYKYLANKKEGSIITARGCPYKCSYCASNMIHKGRVRFRSAQNVADELFYLKEKYGIGLCNFIDDTFILNKKRVYEICDLIEPLNIEWFFLTRVDHVNLELFKRMKKAGCISVTFGFESGSNRILKFLNKNTTIKQAFKAIKVSKEAGFKIRGQLMVGLPTETWQDVKMTAEFIQQANDVDTFGVHVFQPFPGCDVWLNPEKYKFPVNKNTDFSMYHTIGRPEDKLTNNIEIEKQYQYLRSIVNERNIEVMK